LVSTLLLAAPETERGRDSEEEASGGCKYNKEKNSSDCSGANNEFSV